MQCEPHPTSGHAASSMAPVEASGCEVPPLQPAWSLQVGVWGVALWAWLGVNWSLTPAALPVIVGSRLSSTSGNVDKGTRTAVTEAPPAAKTADPTTQEPSSQAPLANNHATNRASQAASMT